MTRQERNGKIRLPTETRTGRGKFWSGRFSVWILVLLPWVLTLSDSGNLLARQDRNSGGEFAESLGNVGPSWYDKKNDRAVWPGTAPERPAVSADRSSIPTMTAKASPTPAARGNVNLDWLGTWTTWGILSILFLLLAGLAIWILSRYQSDSNSVRDAAAGLDDRNRVEHLPFEMDRTIRDFRAAALAAAREKNFRQAIVFLYSHALVMLDKLEVVRLRKGKTNRQYLNEVLRRIPGDAGFRSLMQDFEAVFFGNHPAKEQDFERVLACANSVETLAIQADAGGSL